MDNFVQTIDPIVKAINKQLWGWPMMIILIGFGLLSTLYLGFPQFKKSKLGWDNSFGQIFKRDKSNKEGSMSSFQSLATAVAAQVGTGNIGGVAGAILTGGPGAIFWMWITALVGMGTIFVEALLAQKYRQTRNGELVAGPAFYLSQGLKNHNLGGFGKFLAGAFSVLIIVALGFIGNMTQSNSIASVMTEAFNIPHLPIGIALAVASALVFIGGMSRIGKFAELVVPIMAFIYFIAAIVIIVTYSSHLVPTLKLIFEEAFKTEAVVGGIAGYSIRTAIRYGVARGLFSNEAGMGSTPNSHGVADVPHPVVQGSVAMVGVFIDTMVVCTATALIILVTESYKVEGIAGAQITMQAFNTAIPGIGGKFLAIALLFFAFTTVIGWYYFGEANIKYLFKSPIAVRIYQILVFGFIIIGTVLEIGFVWELADLFNGLMVIPNIIGLYILVKEAKKLTEDYDYQIKNGEALHYHYQYESLH